MRRGVRRELLYAVAGIAGRRNTKVGIAGNENTVS